MTQVATAARTELSIPSLLPLAALVSAALVFFAEPMVGKLILPLLGGSPGVWNASLAFFQAALLAGYAYAHLLQRLRSVRLQASVHLGVLALAALSLPLRLCGLLGEPWADRPVAWLLAELTLTIGAPFCALSATAPLLQAWKAREAGRSEGVYGLYAASNLGSLVALLAYPLLVEPRLTLVDQRAAWTLGFAGFALLMAMVMATRGRDLAAPFPRVATATRGAATPWMERASWVLLAAAPSSLMLGVTTHLASDVGSAPFLWIAPLALYLATFVIAFRDAPVRRRRATLAAQALAAIACLVALGFPTISWPIEVGIELTAFFLTALVCHQALVARKPPAERLTEFYLLVSLGGVLGGGFNAFVAPVVFNRVWEYPLALVGACLARPWGEGRPSRAQAATALLGLCACAALVAMMVTGVMPTLAFLGAAGALLACAWLLRERAPAFALMAAAIALAAQCATLTRGQSVFHRSFFGVHRVLTTQVEGLGAVRQLIHGSTVHGAQMLDPARRCTPMTYYAAQTPIARAFAALHARKPAARIGAVGLGTGAVAALTNPGDTLRFYEIDPVVVNLARDSGLFSYVGACAKGRIDYSVGDGRLGLARAPVGAFDLLLVDAFSSDSVPTHLLTVEAIAADFRTLAPDGVLVLHLTNRNLSLAGPAAAAVRAAGGQARIEAFMPKPSDRSVASPSLVMVAARSPAALQAFAADPRWRPADPDAARAWTDDYTDVLGALVAHVRAAR